MMNMFERTPVCDGLIAWTLDDLYHIIAKKSSIRPVGGRVERRSSVSPKKTIVACQQPLCSDKEDGSVTILNQDIVDVR